MSDVANKPDKPVTLDDLRQCHQSLDCHINMGGGRHFYQYGCVEHPALKMTKRSKNGALQEHIYFVGNVECKNANEVVIALNRHYGFEGATP